MARQTKPLSVKEIESAKPKEADYVLYDGDGPVTYTHLPLPTN
ncbi:UNVERIFIED_CONTAM: hypothetical protein LJD30_23000, partial [Raoultella ornithinolytica]